MSEWKVKRFWKEAVAGPVEGGFSVTLDGRPVKTPAKAAMVLPTLSMADAIAREWDAQEGEVNPLQMPYTRSANAAIDKVALQHAEVADMLAAYGDSDLLCYRATSPERLVIRQAEVWDPYLEWADYFLGAKLVPVTGVMHKAQSPDALAALSKRTHTLDAFALAAFHDLVSLSGSLVLGFAAIYDQSPAAELWEASRLDEVWQQEEWGVDEEAEETSEIKKAAFFHAKAFFDAAQQ